MKIIDKNIFEELNKLMMLKKDYQIFSTELKSKPYINKISLSKGSVEIYLDDNDIEYLIKYYEEKIEKINEKISKFNLTKLNDEIEIIEENKKIKMLEPVRGSDLTDLTSKDVVLKNSALIELCKTLNSINNKVNELIKEINNLKEK